MKKTNKTISLAVAFMLVSIQPMSAGILGEAMDKMENVTSFNNIQNQDGSLDVYSGSVSVRFDFSKTPAPLFSFTPPGISAGCNGVDIKGMTMSLLNLDQLGEMLEDAGVSLAWGIAVGLIYSLPGIASAFKMINSWAKKLQDLLSQACSTGINIANIAVSKSGYNKSKVQSTIDGYFNSLNAETYIKEKQKGDSSILASLGLGDSDSSTEEMTADKKKEAVIKMFKSAFQSDASTLGIMMTDIVARLKGVPMKDSELETLFQIPAIADKAITSSSIRLNATTVDSLGGYLSSGSQSLNAVAQGKLSLFAYVLQFNFIGDLATTIPSDDLLENLFDIANSTQNDGLKSQAKSAFQRIQDIKMTKTTLVSGISGKQDPQTKGKSLAKFLWYGVKNGDNDSTDQLEARRDANANLIAPAFKIYSIADKDTRGDSTYIAILPSNLNGAHQRTGYYSSDLSDVSFQGSLSTSRCVVNELILNGERDAESTCAKAIVFPEIYKYIKIIKDSPQSKRPELKQKLILSMAAKMSTALLNTIQESLSQIHASQSEFAPKSSNDADKQQINNGVDSNAKETIELIQNLQTLGGEVISSAYKSLDADLSEGLASAGMVESLFEKQARENRSRGLRSFQK